MSENVYPKRVDSTSMSRYKRVLALVKGRVRDHLDTVYFAEPTWVYLCYCSIHKVYFLDYVHGFAERVNCPTCLKDILKKMSELT